MKFIEVEVDGVGILEFPEGMSQDDMRNAINRQFFPDKIAQPQHKQPAARQFERSGFSGSPFSGWVQQQPPAPRQPERLAPQEFPRPSSPSPPSTLAGAPRESDTPLTGVSPTRPELPSPEAALHDLADFLSPEQQTAQAQRQRQQQASDMRTSFLKDVQSWTPEKAVTRLGLSIGEGGGQLDRMLGGFLGAAPLGFLDPIMKPLTGETKQQAARRIAERGRETAERYRQMGHDVGMGPALDLPSDLASTFLASSPVIPAAVLGGLPAAVLTAGAMSSGATFDEATEAFKAQGDSQEEAERKAMLPAYLGGMITAGTVALFGKTGAEALARGMTRREMNNMVMTVMKHAGLEGAQETADQIGQSIVSKLTYRPEMTVDEAVEEVLFGLLAGTVLGGAASVGGVAAQRLGRSPEAVQAARMLEENVTNSELNPVLDLIEQQIFEQEQLRESRRRETDEPQRVMDVSARVFAADARTIRQIQNLFPEANLSREQARVLRNLVWGPPEQAVRPEPEAETRTEVREDAIQERETEAVPVEERAAGRAEVEPEVREQTAEQVTEQAVEETVTPEVEPATEQAVEPAAEQALTATEPAAHEPTWPKGADTLEQPLSFWRRFTRPVNVPRMPARTREALVKYAKIENTPRAISDFLSKRVADMEQRGREPEVATRQEQAPEVQRAQVEQQEARLKDRLAKLQKRYEQKLNAKRGAMVPPGIRADALASIAKQMDAIDAELAKLAQAKQPPAAQVEEQVAPEPAPSPAEAVQQSKPDIQQAVASVPTSDLSNLAEAVGIPKGSKAQMAQAITEALTDPNQTPPEPPPPSALGIVPPPIHINPTVAGAAGEQIHAFTSNFLVNLMDRVESGGSPLHQTVASKARLAVDRTKDLLGRLSQATEAAKRASSGGLNPAVHQAVYQLTKPVTLESGHQTTLLQQAMDGDIDLDALSPAQRRITETLIQLVSESGDMLEQANFKVLDPKSPEGIRPFRKKKDGRIFLRLTNSDLYDLLYAGGDNLRRLAQHIASHPDNVEAGITVDQLLTRFREIGEDMRNDTTPEAAFRRINAEIPREVPFFPTHWTHPVTGDTLELLHVRPFDVANRIAETTAHRAGFVEFFGQSISPEDNLVKQIVKQFREAPGEARAFIDLSRALNAQPLEMMRWFEPGSYSSKAGRGIDGALSMAKAHMLGMTSVPNIFEPLVRIQGLGKLQDAMRALWRIHGPGKEVYIESLRELGAIAIGDNIMDMTVDPARPWQSLVRIHNEIASRGYMYRFFWRYQHRLAAAIAQEMADRMQAGQGTDRDVQALMAAMNMTREQAQALRRGKGTEQDYEAFVRRAGAYTTNQPQLAAEMSRAEHTRLFRTAFAFTSYAMMAVRWITRNAMTFAEVAEKTNWGTRDAQGRKEFTGALGNFLRVVVGAKVAGGMTHMVLQFLTGGVEGLKIAASEAKDEPARFIRDSILYVMFAGPFGAVIRSMQNSQGGLGDRLLNFTFPGMFIQEIYNMFNDTGRYRDAKNPVQKAGRFIQRFAPVTRVEAAAFAAFGFGGGRRSEQLHVQAATRAYWRWVRDHDPQRLEGERGRPTPWNKVMRQAYNALQKDQDPDELVWQAMDLEGKSWREAATSLRARKFVHRYRNDPEMLESLRKRVGDDAFDTLQAHDAILEAYAKSIERRR